MGKSMHRNILNNPKLSFSLQEVVKTQLIKHWGKMVLATLKNILPRAAEGWRLPSARVNVSFCVLPTQTLTRRASGCQTVCRAMTQHRQFKRAHCKHFCFTPGCSPSPNDDSSLEKGSKINFKSYK